MWAYGKEVWCNLEGRYVHIVADLKHLTGSYTMSLCSVGIMGASYVRDEPLDNKIEVLQGDSTTYPVPHIYDEFTNIKEPINLRLAAGSRLLAAGSGSNFVTI